MPVPQFAHLYRGNENTWVPGGCACTAAVWGIGSVQMGGVQQLQKSSPVRGCYLGLSPSGEEAAIKTYGVQFLPW